MIAKCLLSICGEKWLKGEGGGLLSAPMDLRLRHFVVGGRFGDTSLAM